MVRSPKSGVNFFSLGDFDRHFDAAYQRAAPAMRQVSAPCMHAQYLSSCAANGGDCQTLNVFQTYDTLRKQAILCTCTLQACFLCAAIFLRAPLALKRSVHLNISMLTLATQSSNCADSYAGAVEVLVMLRKTASMPCMCLLWTEQALQLYAMIAHPFVGTCSA